MAISYSEKLKDVRWQKKRLEVLERAGWKCEDCGAAEGVCLHVHHKWYEREKEPRGYPDECFVACCEDCHDAREQMKREMAVLFPSLTPEMQSVMFEAARASLAEGVQNELMVGISLLLTLTHWSKYRATSQQAQKDRDDGASILKTFINDSQQLIIGIRTRGAS